MVLYICSKCNKSFNRKSNLNNHLNKLRPCDLVCIIEPQIIDIPINNPINNDVEVILGDNKLQNIKLNDSDTIACKYCDMTFTRNNNLQRHLKDRCKSKKHFDELEILKEKLKIIENENEQLKSKILEVEHKKNKQ